MLFKELIDIYSKNHTKPINALCVQNKYLIIVKLCGVYFYRCVLKM